MEYYEQHQQYDKALDRLAAMEGRVGADGVAMQSHFGMHYTRDQFTQDREMAAICGIGRISQVATAMKYRR